MSRFDISDSATELFATAAPFAPINLLFSPDGPRPSQNVANFSRLVSLPQGVEGSEDPRIHWLKEKSVNLKKVSDPSDHEAIDRLIDGEIKNTEAEYSNRTEPNNAFESTCYEGHTAEMGLIFFPGTIGFSPEYNSIRFNGTRAVYSGEDWRGRSVIGSIRRALEDPVTADLASTAAGYVSQLLPESALGEKVTFALTLKEFCAMTDSMVLGKTLNVPVMIYSRGMEWVKEVMSGNEIDAVVTPYQVFTKEDFNLREETTKCDKIWNSVKILGESWLKAKLQQAAGAREVEEVLFDLEFRGLQATPYEEYERARHDLVNDSLALYLGERVGGDIPVASEYSYGGVGSEKTPDIVHRDTRRNVVWIMDTKVTEGNVMDRVAATNQSYGPLAEGLTLHTGSNFRVAPIVLDLNTGEVTTPMELNYLASKIKGFPQVKRLMSLHRVLMRDPNHRARGRARVGGMMAEVENALYHVMEVISSYNTKADGADLFANLRCTDPGPLPSVRATMELNFNPGAVHTDQVVKELAEKIAKAPEPNKVRHPLVSDIINKLPTEFSGEKSMHKDSGLAFFARNAGLSRPAHEYFEQFTYADRFLSDGTIRYVDHEFDTSFDAKGTAPREKSMKNAGLEQQYLREMSRMNLPEIADLIGDVFENIAYLENRRRVPLTGNLRATIEELTPSSKVKKNYRGMLPDERRKGVSVCKSFGSYLLFVRNGSKLTSDKVVRYRLAVPDTATITVEGLTHRWYESPKLKAHLRVTKWLTCKMTDLVHYCKFKDFFKLRGDPEISSMSSKVDFLLMVANKRGISNVLQDTRYAFAGATSLSCDIVGLCGIFKKGHSATNLEDAIRIRSLTWMLEMSKKYKENFTDALSALAARSSSYDKLNLPSFWEPGKTSTGDELIDTIYKGYTFNKEAGHDAHRQAAMVDKMLECESKFRTRVREGKTRGMRGDKDTSDLGNFEMFDYSNRCVAAGSSLLLEDLSVKILSWAAIIKFLTSPVNSMLSIKSSMLPAGFNKRMSRSKVFVTLTNAVRKAGCLRLQAINILSLRFESEEEKYVRYGMHDKKQIGGPREITTQTMSTRRRFRELEGIMEALCSAQEREMITDKDKKSRQSNAASEQREFCQEGASAGERFLPLNANLDATRWSPGFQPTHFAVMVKSLPLPKSMKSRLLDIISRNVIKRNEIPEAALNKMAASESHGAKLWKFTSESSKRQAKHIDENKKRSDTIGSSYEKLSDAEKEIYLEALSRESGECTLYSSMGQGVFHFTSSLWHTAADLLTDRVFDFLVKRMKGCNYVSKSLLSSDDKTKIVAFKGPNLPSVLTMASLFINCVSLIPTTFNIHLNLKKSNFSILMAEFNSFFTVYRRAFMALIKDEYSLASVPDLQTPYAAVEEKLGSLRRAVENGMPLSRMIDCSKVIRAQLLRYYRIDSEAALDMARQLACSVDELPAELGFFPVKDILPALILGMNSLTAVEYSATLSAFKAVMLGSRALVTNKSGEESVHSRLSINIPGKFHVYSSKLKNSFLSILNLNNKTARYMSGSFLSLSTGISIGQSALASYVSFSDGIETNLSIREESKIVMTLVQALGATRIVKIDGCRTESGKAVYAHKISGTISIILSLPFTWSSFDLYRPSVGFVEHCRGLLDGLSSHRMTSREPRLMMRKVSVFQPGLGISSSKREVYEAIMTSKHLSNKGVTVLTQVIKQINPTALVNARSMVEPNRPFKSYYNVFGAVTPKVVDNFLSYFTKKAGFYKNEILIRSRNVMSLEEFANELVESRFFANRTLEIALKNSLSEFVSRSLFASTPLTAPLSVGSPKISRFLNLARMYETPTLMSEAQRVPLVMGSYQSSFSVLTDGVGFFFFRTTVVNKSRQLVSRLYCPSAPGFLSDELIIAIMKEVSRYKVSTVPEGFARWRGTGYKIVDLRGVSSMRATRSGLVSVLDLAGFPGGITLGQISFSYATHINPPTSSLYQFRLDSVRNGDIISLDRFILLLRGGYESSLIASASLSSRSMVTASEDVYSAFQAILDDTAAIDGLEGAEPDDDNMALMRGMAAVHESFTRTSEEEEPEERQRSVSQAVDILENEVRRILKVLVRDPEMELERYELALAVAQNIDKQMPGIDILKVSALVKILGFKGADLAGINEHDVRQRDMADLVYFPNSLMSTRRPRVRRVVQGAQEGVMRDVNPEIPVAIERYADLPLDQVREVRVEADREVNPLASVGSAGPPVYIGPPQVTQIEIDEEEAGRAALIAEQFQEEAAQAEDDELRQEREDLRRQAQEISNTLVRRVIATRERESGTTARLPYQNAELAPVAPLMDNERGLNRSLLARALSPRSVKEKVAVGLLTLGAAALYGVFSLYT